MTLGIRKVALWLGVIIGICYVGSLGGTYHFDDSHSVESNIAIRSLANIPSFWTDPRTSSFIPENRVYRPLVYTFYSVCWLIGGGATWPFHIMKMGMHLLVCLALFLIWRRLFQEPGWFPARALKIKFPMVSEPFALTGEFAAFLLALLFAVHPACSECVDYISATTSLQCAMFYVWAFIFYLRFRDEGDRRFLVAALFTYFLSVASKEEGITLPAMILVTELFLSKGAAAARLRVGIARMFPFAALALVLAGWIYVMHPTSGNESRGWVTPGSYFITQWRAYLWYMRLWFWPWDLNADNASIEFSKNLSDPLVIQAAIGNLLILLFAWVNRKRYPAMLFGMIWFYVTISPASSVVVLAEAINEHRMYLSYIGFVGGTLSVLLHWVEQLSSAEARPFRMGAMYSAIFIALVIGAQERNRVWATDENLWADTVEKNPTSGRALNNLALVHMSRGEYDKAIELFGKCEQVWSTYMYCPLNRGVAYSSAGLTAYGQGKKDEADKKFAEAEKALLRAYGLSPQSVHANFHLARFYEEVRKDYAKAVPMFRFAVEGTGGRYPAADMHLATCLTHLHDFDNARIALKRAISVEPDNQGAIFQLGMLEFEAGKLDDAAAAYTMLTQVNPRHVQAWYNYGVVLLAKKDFDGARKAFQATIALDPKSEQGWFNLAFASEHLGDAKDAVEAARQLTALNPQKAEYQSRLRELEKKFGKVQS